MGSCLPTRLQEDHFDLLNFIFECRRHDWEKVENYACFIDVNHKLKSISDRRSINGGHCLLANFLRNTDGKQAEILESLLFPQPFQGKPRRPCDIFDQQFEPDYAKSKDECLTYPSPFPFLFTTRLEYETSRSIPRDRSLAPYVKLLLEAAGILPSPQNRNDPSLWTKYGDRWNHDKEAFVWNEVVLTFLKYHPQDVETFKLILDTGGLMSDDHVIEFICLIAASQEPTTPILQYLLSSGKFPEKLKNENISSFWADKKSLCPPLLGAACLGNVDFVKELVANNVGGDINVAQLTKPDTMWSDALCRSTLRKIPKIAQGNYDDGENAALYFTDMNILHLVAAVDADHQFRAEKDFDDILTVLLAMPGSTDLINAIAPFYVAFDTISGNRRHVTPAVFAAMTSHESRMKILLANGGDTLPDSWQHKRYLRSFNQWLEDYNNSDYLGGEKHEMRGY